MQKQINAKNGVYLLELEIGKKRKFPTDRFEGYFNMPGYYYYAGSAQKNLLKRIERHLKPGKTIHWHIDHLTTGTNFIKRIFIFENASKELECSLIAFLIDKIQMQIPVKNFGNGDCTRKCPSHLLFSKKKISQSQLLDLYHSIVCFIPSSKGTFWE